MYHVICPKCGQESPANIMGCPNCGMNLMGVPWKETPEEMRAIAEAARGPMNNLACPKCGQENPAGAKHCGHCGHDLLSVKQPGPAPVPTPLPPQPSPSVPSWSYSPPSHSGSNYTTLRTMASLFIVLAWVVAILFGLLALGSLVALSNASDGTFFGLLTFAALAVSGVIGYAILTAIGESTLVIIDIEANTRMAVLHAERQAQALNQRGR